MDERNLQRIARHLKDEAAQRRVYHNIQRGRNEVTVTIGRAARLFGFSESQLRDWEKMGLIKPLRPKEESANKQTTGQRQYSFAELDKLAIIRELLDEARMTPGAIPPNIDEIWSMLASSTQFSEQELVETAFSEVNGSGEQQQDEHINKRITLTYRDQMVWRYYASRILWISLLLAYEPVPGCYAGLVLPAHTHNLELPVCEPANLQNVGESLVGWLGQTSSFFTFLTASPTFEYPSDYVIQPLCPPELLEKLPFSTADRTIIVVQRDELEHIQRDESVIRTIRRLLEPLYEEQDLWQHYMGKGRRDMVDVGMDFTPKLTDAVLTSLANMVIRLGGKRENGEDRWRDCCILLPSTMQLPLQQRSLIVRARSRFARHSIGATMVSPERQVTSLSLRAYQSSHIIYRPVLAREEVQEYYRDIEGPILSNIAVPIGGESGHALGVLYATSLECAAFSEEDQRILRVIAKLIEELLYTYRIRQNITETIGDLLKDPRMVDPLFKEFAAESDFLDDLEEILKTVRRQVENGEEITIPTATDESVQEISFIAIDIDSNVQESIANSYGDQTLHHLNKAIGLRIHDLLPALFSNHLNCKLYHIYGGIYCLLLRGFSLERSKNNAERLRKALEGSIAVKQSDLPGGTLMLPEISVHLGVTWYPYEKLADFLSPRHKRPVTEVRSTLYHSLDFALKLGTDTGGNIVYSWDSGTQTYAPYEPGEEQQKNR
ncbi:MerR family transcriptional regulator [Ktedonobacteria bacterium brp13]|nr:MerR family transcriptional regulator [Ktedonobacteria bacterium brp13]